MTVRGPSLVEDSSQPSRSPTVTGTRALASLSRVQFLMPELCSLGLAYGETDPSSRRGQLS
jgi:hypothetical protein